MNIRYCELETFNFFKVRAEAACYWPFLALGLCGLLALWFIAELGYLKSAR